MPKCIGGDDSLNNIIILSGRAHYIAHLILSKAFPKNWKLKAAVGAMSMNKSLNSRQIEESRRQHSESLRLRPKEKHPCFGKTWNSLWKGGKHSNESKIKMSQSAKKRWAKGIPDNTRENMRIAAKKRMEDINIRNKISKTLTGSKQSQKSNNKRKNSMKKLKWWNNGIKSIRTEQCPEGFVSGRIKWKNLNT